MDNCILTPINDTRNYRRADATRKPWSHKNSVHVLRWAGGVATSRAQPIGAREVSQWQRKWRGDVVGGVWQAKGHIWDSFENECTGEYFPERVAIDLDALELAMKLGAKKVVVSFYDNDVRPRELSCDEITRLGESFVTSNGVEKWLVDFDVWDAVPRSVVAQRTQGVK